MIIQQNNSDDSNENNNRPTANNSIVDERVNVSYIYMSRVSGT